LSYRYNKRENNIMALKVENQGEIIPITFLTSFISMYDGKNSNLHKFIKDCDYAYNLAQGWQKDVLFKFIVTRISGKAEAALSCRQINKWDDCRNFLLENFSEIKCFTQLLSELQNCRQTRHESVVEYTQRIDKCYSNLMRAIKNDTTDSSELIGKHAMIKQMTLQTFMMGTLPQYQTILRARDPDSFEEAAQFAINEEKLTQASTSFLRLDNRNKTTCSICNKTGHISKNCYRNNSNSDYTRVRYNNEPNRSNNRRVFQTDSSEGKGRSKNEKKVKKCYYCDKPGHLKKDCYAYKRSLNQQGQAPVAEVKLASILEAEFSE
jgi:hypothetical protein